MSRVLTMLNHYYVGKQEAQVQRAIANDWWECLKEFPKTAIFAACLSWVKTRTRRPTPADIRCEILGRGSETAEAVAVIKILLEEHDAHTRQAIG